MEYEKTVVEDQMATSLFDLLKNPLSWIVVLASLLTFVTFWIFGSFSILFTSTVLILSTVLFIFSKRKPKLVEKSVKEEIHKSALQESSPQIEDICASKQQHESEINTQQKQASEGEGGSYQVHDYLLRSSDVLSEKECADQLSTTEDSEVDWPFPDNMDRSPDYSDDGSISDEDSLIEISLPGGHYVSHKADEPNKYSMQHKLSNFMPETIFQQRSLMELLAEFNDMNEEDNLIEIDISMGSIKCSRFEIEA
ncbi:hypothetical protein REPUB_Repub17cG0035400 [Reevesia pubescens]